MLHRRSRLWQQSLSTGLTILLLIGLIPFGLMASPGTASAQTAPPPVVISQVYGGGGNSGAPYTHDFIELFNRGTEAVSLEGWSVQYASSTGSNWQKTDLSGTIQPGRYYLIQQAAGNNTFAPLPAPDVTDTIPIAATAGKVALVKSTTALTGSCPSTTAIVDLVGFGGANCFEGAATPALTNSTAAIRNDKGCMDTGNNALDFATGTPAPRNSASPANVCAVPAPVAPAIGAITPADGAITLNLRPAISAAFTWNGAPGTAAMTLNGEPVAAEVIDSVISYTPAEELAPGRHTVSVTVTNGEEQTAQRSWSLELVAVSPIGAARALAEGAPVAIQGTITGLFGNSSFYLQDETGGLQVFATGAAAGRQLGETVTLTGAMAAFNGERQLSLQHVASAEPGEVPVARTVTLDEVAAREGELLHVQSVTVTSTAANQFVVTDGTANLTIFNASGVISGFSQLVDVGQVVQVTGLGSRFNSTIQLKPRSAADIVVMMEAPTPAPAVSLLEPADGAARVELNAPIRATFARAVTLPDGAAAGPVPGVSVTAGGSQVEGISATLLDGTITISGLTRTFGTTYRVTIPAGAVQSASELESAEITWSFTTRTEFPTIAEVRATASGTVTTRGVVTALFGNEMHIQDETGGIALFQAGMPYQVGDLIQVTGTRGVHSTNQQISPVSAHQKLGTAPVPAPLVSTIGGLGDAQVGQLVRIEGLKLSTLPTNPVNTYNTSTTAGGATIPLRIDSFASAQPSLHANLHTAFKGGDVVDVTGVLVMFNGNRHIKPRVLTDVVDPSDTEPPVLTHTPPAAVAELDAIMGIVTASDNRYVVGAQAHYRTGSSGPFTTVELPRSGAGFQLAIPGSAVTGAAVQYYLTATDGRNPARLPAGDGLFTVTVIPDTTGPAVSSLYPFNGLIVNQPRPHIMAAFSDPSGIDAASVQLIVGGQDVTSKAIVTTGSISFSPGTDLPAGLQQVSLTVRDTKGNPTTRSWSFTTTAPAVGQGKVLLSELFILSRTPGQLDEYVKVYNSSATPVSLGGWTLTTVTQNGTTATATFPEGAEIAGGQHAVATLNADRYRRNVDPYASPVTTFEYGAAASGFGARMTLTNANIPVLHDDAGTVIIRDSQGIEVDVVRYTRCASSAGAVTCQNPAPYSGTGWVGEAVRWPPTLAWTNNGKVLSRAIDETTITWYSGGQYKLDTDRAVDWLSAATDSAGGWFYWQNPASMGPGPLGNRHYEAGQMFSLPMPAVSFDGTVTAFLAPDTAHETIIDFFHSATQSIDLNIYQFELVSVAEALIAARQRGVEVRVLIEGNPCCDNRIPDQTRYVATLMHNAGIEVRFMFSDAANERYRRYSNVNHAKYAVVDDGTANAQLMIFSGNFRGSSMPTNTASGNREWGAIIQNREIAQFFGLVFQFDFDPNQPDSVPYGYGNLGPPPASFTPSLTSSGDPAAHYQAPFSARTVSGSFTVTPVMVPETAFLSSEGILGMVKNAQESVMLEWATLNPYWNTHTGASSATTPMPLVQELINAARRGVQVRVLLEGKFSDGGVRSNLATVNYLNGIAEAEGLDMVAKLMPFTVIEGVLNGSVYRVVEFPGYTGMHNKGIIVDGYRTLVSSVNGTQPSWLQNREAAVIIDNAEIASFYLDAFWLDWYDGETRPEWPVITEVNKDGQWVELFNPTGRDLDLTGWSIGGKSGQWLFPAGTLLPDGGVLTIEGLSVDRSGDLLRLMGPQDREVDRVAWNGFIQDWTLIAQPELSLVRTNACQDTNSRIDWAAAAATPGQVVCHGTEHALTAAVAVVSPPVTDPVPPPVIDPVPPPVINPVPPPVIDPVPPPVIDPVPPPVINPVPPPVTDPVPPPVTDPVPPPVTNPEPPPPASEPADPVDPPAEPMLPVAGNRYLIPVRAEGGALLADLDRSLLAKAAAEGRAATIETDAVRLDLSPELLASLAAREGAGIRILVEVQAPSQASGAGAQGLTLAGPVLKLTAMRLTGDQVVPLIQLDGTIKVRFPYTTDANPAHLGVYRLNPATGAWEFRGGKLNAEERYLELGLTSFSQYAVMAFTVSFSDVAAHWAKADVERMAARHIVKGTTETTFSPDESVTRAQFAILLVRALGLAPYTGLERSFADVAPSDWYFAEVEAASRAGLIRGAEGQFSPNRQISRQEMAVMLGRALALRGQAPQLETARAAALIGGFADKAEAGDWALEAMAIMVELGLMNGRTETTFAPLANSTRAEAVVVLRRLLTALDEL